MRFLAVTKSITSWYSTTHYDVFNLLDNKES